MDAINMDAIFEIQRTSVELSQLGQLFGLVVEAIEDGETAVPDITGRTSGVILPSLNYILCALLDIPERLEKVLESTNKHQNERITAQKSD